MNDFVNLESDVGTNCYVRPDDVIGVELLLSAGGLNSCIYLSGGSTMYVIGTPTEVVEKLTRKTENV